MPQTANGHTLELGDVAFVRETSTQGAIVRKILVVGENGPVITFDQWDIAANGWADTLYFGDAGRLELLYRVEAHNLDRLPNGVAAPKSKKTK